MKIIFTGKESAGKSLKLAMQAREIAHRNAKWLSKTGVPRPIASNMRFSEEFYNFVVNDLGVPIVYWQNIDELIEFTEADVIIDEVGNYFDSRLWSQLSLDARRWLTQGAKTGIHIYGAAQDFSQIDKSFRLLVTETYHVTKIIGSPRPMKTRPDVKRIWGLCMSRRVNPKTFKGDDVSMETIGWPSFFLIQKEDCDVFSTSQRIVKSAPPKLKHIEQICDVCGKLHPKHV